LLDRGVVEPALQHVLLMLFLLLLLVLVLLILFLILIFILLLLLLFLFCRTGQCPGDHCSNRLVQDRLFTATEQTSGLD